MKILRGVGGGGSEKIAGLGGLQNYTSKPGDDGLLFKTNTGGWGGLLKN